MPNSVICLMGPTASGKTDLAVQLAKRLSCAVISVDSALVYRGMNIGTAKPEPSLLAEVPHALIDICDPSESYSAGRFYDDVVVEIERAFAASKIPLLVGGTMMYFNVLQRGLSNLPAANPGVREQLLADADKHGWPAQHERLSAIDPAAAARIKPTDKQRLQRALEVHALTGESLSTQWAQASRQSAPYDFINIGLMPSDRAWLHARIEQRFDEMLALGFLGEANGLYQREDIQAELPSMRAVGYRQAWAHFDGTYDVTTMREKAIIATRQLAKRQMTWLRRWPNMTLLDSLDEALLTHCLEALQAQGVTWSSPE